jgi:hypothetical protein
MFSSSGATTVTEGSSFDDVAPSAVGPPEVEESSPPPSSPSELPKNVDTTIAEEDDDDEIAVAAEAAANAVEEADAAVQAHQQAQHAQLLSTVTSHPHDRRLQNPVCRVCCQSSASHQNTNRPMIRFLPTVTPTCIDPASVENTFGEDVSLHIFCGKTASFVFLNNNNNSSNAKWEIISKAGLKHKYGIGPEVNAALASTRCAILDGGSAGVASMSSRNKKQSLASRSFYLVREFEAVFAVIQNGSVPVDCPTNHRHEQQQLPRPQQHHLLLPDLLLAPAPAPASTSLLYANPFGGNDPFSSTATGINDALFQYQLQQTEQAFKGNRAADALGISTSPSQDSTTPTSSPPVGPIHPPLLPLCGPALMNFSSFPTSGAADSQSAYIEDITTTMSTTTTITTATHRGGKRKAIKAGNSGHAPKIYRFDRKGKLVDNAWKVLCECGGRHKPDDGTYAGKLSWRNHAMTKQHQEWLRQHETSM